MPKPEEMATPGHSMERWIRPTILDLQSYHVTPAAGMIKLDAMENPYIWPAELRQEWAACLAKVDVNRYPDPRSEQLTSRLRAAFDLPPALELILGNGSDELLQIVMLAIARAGNKLLVPEPTFSMYRIIANIVGLEYVGVPLREQDYQLNVDATLAAIAIHKPALLILCYPNNPTGTLFHLAEVERLVEAAPGLVLIDEAYFHFAQSTFLSLALQNPNVVVLRTLSKLGLAGLRLGMLSGQPVWLEQFEKMRLPYNINALTQTSAVYMLDQIGVLGEQVAQIRAERDRLLDELLPLGPGLEVWPSSANFLLLRVSGYGPRIYQGLIELGILVKNLNGSHPLLRDCLRVTIGSPDENRAFLSALKQVLASF